MKNYLDFFCSPTYGRVLVLDGYIQLCTFDEFGYHETLAFVALTCHRNPKNASPYKYFLFEMVFCKIFKFIKSLTVQIVVEINKKLISII